MAIKRVKKVLVTGAGGFIGSHLCEQLLARGYAVRAVIRYNSRNHWGWLEGCAGRSRRLEVVSGDVRNYDSMLSLMRGVHGVFHLAALIGIPYSYQSPQAYVDTNIRGTLNVLQAALACGAKRFIQTSTSEVYGTARFVPITENHPLHPQSPYAASKVASDAMALSFWHSFGLPVTVVRPFNTFGPRQSCRAVIPTIITQMLEHPRSILLGSLSPTRDFTFVRDTAAGFIAAYESDAAAEVINLGTFSEISVGDLAKKIARIIGVRVALKSDECRLRPAKSEVERLFADNAKARRLLGWQPVVSLDQGLAETVSWFRKNSRLFKSGVYNV